MRSDVVKVRLMTDKHHKFSGALDCARKVLLHEGPMAFYKGFSMCWGRVSCSPDIFMRLEQATNSHAARDAHYCQLPRLRTDASSVRRWTFVALGFWTGPHTDMRAHLSNVSIFLHPNDHDLRSGSRDLSCEGVCRIFVSTPCLYVSFVVSVRT